MEDVSANSLRKTYNDLQRFDQLCFLVRGQVVYLGAGDHVMQYFTALGFPLPSYENPSDFYMRIMQVSPHLRSSRAKPQRAW